MKKTAKYYNSGTEGAKKAKAKKNAYQKRYNRRKDQVAKRVVLNRENRKHGVVGDGKDFSHAEGGKLVLEIATKNRARNGMKKGRPKSIRTNTKKR